MAKVFWTQRGAKLVHERYRSILEHWPVRNEQLTVPTRQGATFVLASGPKEAPPLVLLHGGLTTSAMWSRSVGAWAEHFRVYAVDLIGEAGFSAASRPWMWSGAHARWLDDVWAALGITSATVIGASLGGWIALDYAIRRPGNVSALVLLAPAGVVPFRLSVMLKAAPLLLMGPWGHRRALKLDMGFDPDDARSSEGVAFLSFFGLVAEHFVGRMQAIPTFSHAMLRRIEIPVLAIVGGKDAYFDSEKMKRRLANCMPQTQVDYLPEAGHALVDSTARVTKFLLALKTI
jgi:pimeloyl-ACP methyl ester carboxylesterase